MSKMDSVTQDILGEIRKLGLNMENILRRKNKPTVLIVDLESALSELKYVNKLLNLERINSGKQNDKRNY
jgi:hypothetical protein